MSIYSETSIFQGLGHCPCGNEKRDFSGHRIGKGCPIPHALSSPHTRISNPVGKGSLVGLALLKPESGKRRVAKCVDRSGAFPGLGGLRTTRRPLPSNPVAQPPPECGQARQPHAAEAGLAWLSVPWGTGEAAEGVRGGGAGQWRSLLPAPGSASLHWRPQRVPVQPTACGTEAWGMGSYLWRPKTGTEG